MSPDDIQRYEILRAHGLRTGQFNPVHAYINAGRQAAAAGIARDYWAVLLPKEREYIIRFKDCRNTPWLYTDGLSPIAYAQAIDSYTPPPPQKPRGQSYFPYRVDNMRIRGGVLTFAEPPKSTAGVFLLPGPRIAGLLTSGPIVTPNKVPYRQLATPIDYWQAIETLTGRRFAECES